jgi:hypothetical protein
MLWYLCRLQYWWACLPSLWLVIEKILEHLKIKPATCKSCLWKMDQDEDNMRTQLLGFLIGGSFKPHERIVTPRSSIECYRFLQAVCRQIWFLLSLFFGALENSVAGDMTVYYYRSKSFGHKIDEDRALLRCTCSAYLHPAVVQGIFSLENWCKI